MQTFVLDSFDIKVHTKSFPVRHLITDSILVLYSASQNYSCIYINAVTACGNVLREMDMGVLS